MYVVDDVYQNHYYSWNMYDVIAKRIGQMAMSLRLIRDLQPKLRGLDWLTAIDIHHGTMYHNVNGQGLSQNLNSALNTPQYRR